MKMAVFWVLASCSLVEVYRRWIGHILRKTEGGIERAALDCNPQGARRRGRPRKTWENTVEEEAAEMGKTGATIVLDGDVSQMPYAPVRSDRKLDRFRRASASKD
jgi:hypothetical protein